MYKNYATVSSSFINQRLPITSVLTEPRTTTTFSPLCALELFIENENVRQIINTCILIVQSTISRFMRERV